MAAELDKAAEFVHFACTSEDINNTSHALQIRNRARPGHCYLAWTPSSPSCARWRTRIAQVPMLSRTHGQTASPTTLGKELANVVMRLQRPRRGSPR